MKVLLPACRQKGMASRILTFGDTTIHLPLNQREVEVPHLADAEFKLYNVDAAGNKMTPMVFNYPDDEQTAETLRFSGGAAKATVKTEPKTTPAPTPVVTPPKPKPPTATSLDITSDAAVSVDSAEDDD